MATVGGLLLLLPEYLSTVLIRRAGRAPWGVTFTYGEAVEHLVLAGRRASAEGLAGFLADDRARKWLLTLTLLATVLWANNDSCAGAATVATWVTVASVASPYVNR